MTNDFVKIEDKLKIVAYQTVVYKDWNNWDTPDFLLEEEYNVLVAMFMLGIQAALCDVINPKMIEQHGDEALKKNYESIVRVAEKFGVIETYAKDNKVEQSSSIKEVETS